MMEELFHRDPIGSIRFLNGLMQAGFVHSGISVMLMSCTLFGTWNSKLLCDQPLRTWIIIQLTLQCVQLISRWQLSTLLPAVPTLITDDPAASAEQSRQTLERLSLLIHSKKWTINRMFGLLALVCFLLGIWWVYHARSCQHTPMLWNGCAALLLLFCTRTAFVYLWFGYCFAGDVMVTPYAGPFVRPGVSQLALDAMEVSSVTEEDVAGKDLNCAICLADFEVGEEVRRMGCSHFFHTSCIDEWLRLCSTCPLCNDDVLTPRKKQLVEPKAQPVVEPETEEVGFTEEEDSAEAPPDVLGSGSSTVRRRTSRMIDKPELDSAHEHEQPQMPTIV
eukprot:TRINITY_DN2822_c0_g1_i1.p1 TRINITY_DN2822_c0_g1~~TRINITY_DN2822_c0_g1_i1.p1  ORF type:complete len:334 (+),score=59.12 TRINITY_DN2822_c0_g1_i1:277-1278(+)